MQRGNSFARIATAAHANFVESIALRVIADRQRERQSILDHHRIAAHISLAADATKLMHAGISADVRAIIDDHMTGEGRSIGHDYVIADQGVRTDEAVLTDLGFGTDDGGRMNLHRGFAALNGRCVHWEELGRSAMMLINSASAQSCPSTFASPRIR